MKTSSSEIILDYLRQQGQGTPKDLTLKLGLSSRAVFKQLKNLIEKGLIKKLGAVPQVFYTLSEHEPPKPTTVQIPEKVSKLLEKDFLLVSPTGKISTGVAAFAAWCEERSLEITKAANDYQDIRQKHKRVGASHLINGMKKFRDTFDEVFLNEAFYIDFYSIERFGKTKLGQLLLYAKQSQSKPFIRELIQDIQPKIKDLISRYHIDGIAYIPPTVKREVQFMKELENHLQPGVSKFSLVKVKSPLMIPQKTLSKLSDRIENARETIIVNEKRIYKNILIIDDAVGSGATLNESAKKIRTLGLCTGKIIGLAITGSAKGFDVISEV